MSEPKPSATRANESPASGSGDAPPSNSVVLSPEVVDELLATPIEPDTSLQLTVQRTTTHEGPLPAPQTLQAYAEIIPNGAERFMVLVEKQTDHRMDMEVRAIELEREALHVQRDIYKGEHARSLLGLGAGLITCVSGFGLSYALIMAGHELGGAAFGAGTIASIVGAFIYGTKARKEESIAIAQQKSQSEEADSDDTE